MKNVLKLWQYIPDWGIDKLKFLEQISIPGPIEFPYRPHRGLNRPFCFYYAVKYGRYLNDKLFFKFKIVFPG